MKTLITKVAQSILIIAAMVSCNSSSFHNRTDDDPMIHNLLESGLHMPYCRMDKKITIHDVPIEWTQDSEYDSLSVFCSNGKRGYYNSYTDEIVLPARYRRAWIFAEGLAAVQLNSNIGFIDKQGNVAIDFIFPYLSGSMGDNVFHNGVCVIAGDNGKCGVINKEGEWLIRPEWDSISTFKNYIIVTRDRISQQLLYDGSVVNSFILDDIKELIYSRVECREFVVGHVEDREAMYYTGLYAYQIGECWGMMDSDCNKLTEPLYVDIVALGPNIFRAYLLDGYHEVILNSKGEVLK